MNRASMNTGLARRSTLIAMLVLVAASLALLAPALRPGFVLLATDLPYLLDPLWQPLAPPGAVAGANPVLSDQFYQYHAWKTTLRQMLTQGDLSWWSAATNGGQPFL